MLTAATSSEELSGDDTYRYNQAYVWTICLVAAIGGFLFGYDWVVVGGAKPFYEPYFHLETAFQKGWGTSSALIGCVLGALLCFYISDKWGRKKLLIAAGLLFSVSALGTAGSTDFAWFNIFRIVGGLAIGIALNVSPLYIAEMSPAPIRGKFVSLNQLMIMVGVLAAQLANWQISLLDTHLPANATDEVIRQSWAGQTGWRYMFGLQIIPSLLFFILMLFMPESAKWLLKTGALNKAGGIFKKIGGEAYAQAQFALGAKNDDPAGLQPQANVGLSHPAVFKVVLLGIFLALLQQWCGMNVVFYYAADIFQAAGYDIQQMMLNIVVIGSIMVIAVVATIFLVDRVGRKTLMLVGTLGMAVVYGLIGYCFLTGVRGVPIVVLTLVNVAIYSLTLAPVVWVILSEIFPGAVRGTALSIAAVALWIGNFSLTFTFPAIKDYLDWPLNFWLYGGICLLGAGVVFFRLPETKGKSLEEIEFELIHKQN